MTHVRFISRFIFCSAALTLAYGCSSDSPPADDTGGTGGTGVAGKPGTGGSAGHGGTIGSGGTGGTVGSAGTGGSSAAGGTVGSAGTGGTATGGAGHGGMPGGAGTGAMSGAGGTMPMAGAGGHAGSGMFGAGGMSGSGNPQGGRGGREGTAGMGGAGAGGSGAGAGGSGGMSMGSGMSAGCGKMPTISSGMYNNGQHISITVGSMQRRFILNVPTNYDNTHPYKLVIAYHELNGNDDEMYKNKYYHLLPLSNNEAIFVAPNGQQNNASCTQASGCGWPNPNNTDLNFADAVVKELEDNFCIDTNRIFATGWSYGGSMSYKTACERPLGATNGFVRAIAVYSGSQLSGNCTPTKPVAYFASHGTHDSVLNYDNGVGLAQNFAKADGCTWATPTKVTSGAHVCTNEMGCSAGYPVTFCSFNGDHTPDPDNGQSGSSWVYQPVWDFFKQF